MSATFPVVKGVLCCSKRYTWNTADSLGRGASATVYLGRQRDTGLVVAVKSFHRSISSSSQSADLRELELLRQLNHANIIQLLDIQFEESSHQPVLVMEYCEGGSLHHMLEQAAYYYGLPEPEYLLVLTHVAHGMAYLRAENIIHRDIKPGNIIRYVDDDGESVYKLTDFGAARNLDDEEQFESLYGTEEYLHPGVYERAVLRHKTGAMFDARIDLWSLGVTFFHAATGSLPFQPYGGRSNKEIMFKIISQKDSGVISGVQKSQNGPIEWKRDLPDSCPLSNGLRSLVTPLLSGLMEPDQSKMITYDAFFQIVDSVRQKATITIFHFALCQEITLYIDKKSNYSDIQDTIARLFDISATDQILLVNGKRIDKVIDPLMPLSDYPTEMTKDSVFLFHTYSTGELPIRNPDIPSFPEIKKHLGMDTDSRNANQCSALGELIRRYATNVAKQQDLIVKGLLCLRLYLESCHEKSKIAVDLMQKLMTEFEVHLDNFFKMVELVKKRSVPPSHKDRVKLEDICADGLIGPVFTKARGRFSDIVGYKKSLMEKLDAQKRDISALVSQCRKDKCGKKISHHLSVIGGVQSRFRRDKNVRHQMTSHDENIHHFEREKLHLHCVSLKSILESHCFKHTYSLYHKAIKCADALTKNLSQVKKIEENMTVVLNCQKLLSDKVVKMRQSCITLTLSTYDSIGYGSAGSMESDIAEQTKSLENKLVNLTTELEFNSNWLHQISDSLEDGSLVLASRSNDVSLGPLKVVDHGVTDPD